MKHRTGKAVVVILLILIFVAVIDWHTSKGGVVTKDGITLIEDDRLRLFGSENVAGYGLSGSLATLPGGCVGLTAIIDDSQVSFPVIWEHGTELVSGDPLRVKFGGRTYSEGDDISGGSKGRYTAVNEAFFDQIPDSCRAKKYDHFRADD